MLLLLIPLSTLSAQTDFNCASVIQIPTIECEALVAFYASTNGDAWRDNSGWLQTNTPCNDWVGLDCNNEGRVHVLGLPANGLTGELPAQLGALTELNRLRLDANSISGEIPPELGQLKHVLWVRLEDNQLTGPIPPELGDMTDLENLYLSGNSLRGGLPPTLGSLANMQKLYLDSIGVSGEVPTEFGNLKQLSALTLSGNDALTGSLPDSLVSLENLIYFHYLGTAICQPADDVFQDWIAGIGDGHYSEDLSCDGGLIVREGETNEAVAAVEDEAVSAETQSPPTQQSQPEPPSNPFQPIILLVILFIVTAGGIVYGYRQY